MTPAARFKAEGPARAYSLILFGGRALIMPDADTLGAL